MYGSNIDLVICFLGPLRISATFPKEGNKTDIAYEGVDNVDSPIFQPALSPFAA